MVDQVEILLEEIKEQLVELNKTMARIKLGVVDGAENQIPVQIRDELKRLVTAMNRREMSEQRHVTPPKPDSETTR